jgi:hypothetical protein
MSRFNYRLYRFAYTHCFKGLAYFIEPQSVRDQLLNRQYARLEDSCNFREGRALDKLAENGGFVARNRVLIQSALGVLIDAK